MTAVSSTGNFFLIYDFEIRVAETRERLNVYGYLSKYLVSTFARAK